VDNRRHQVQ